MTVTILHASDFHFSSVPNKVNHYDRWSEILATGAKRARSEIALGFTQTSHDRDIAGYVAEFVGSRLAEKDVGMVAITGDLAATGFSKDLIAAKSYFMGLNPVDSVAWPNMFVPKDKLFLMPGNHDRYRYGGGIFEWLSECLSPGSKEFESQFEECWTRRTVERRRQGGEKCPQSGGEGDSCVAWAQVKHSSSGLPEVFVVAADFCLRQIADAERMSQKAPLGYAGQGSAYPDTLQVLQAVTDQLQRDHKPCIVIWLIHFPPIPFRELKDPDSFRGERNMRLIGSKTVVDAAEKCRVGLILSGHLHRNFSTRRDTTRVWCADAATIVRAGRKHQHRIYEIELSKMETAGWVLAKQAAFSYRNDDTDGWGFHQEPIATTQHAWKF